MEEKTTNMTPIRVGDSILHSVIVDGKTRIGTSVGLMSPEFEKQEEVDEWYSHYQGVIEIATLVALTIKKLKEHDEE